MTPGLVLSWLVAIGIPIVIGYSFTLLFWPSKVSRTPVLAFAPVMGLGICSLIFFVFRRPMFTVEIGLLLVAVVVLVRRRSRVGENSLGTVWRVPLGVFLAIALGWALSGMIQRIDRLPHGDWDAWAIWNSHSRYLYRDGPAWQTNIKNTFHADYPLLVPSLTARMWRYAGADTPDAGGVPGILFTLSGVAILATVLMELRSISLAILAALVLVTTPFYLEHGVSQSADVPMAAYVLSTVPLISLHLERGSETRGLLVLAGLTAGFAAWTKNEGLAVVIAVAASLMIPLLLRPAAALRRLLPFLAGLLLPLAVVLFFKFSIAPANDIFGERNSAEFLAKLLDPSRYATVLKAISATFWSFGGWAIHPVLPLIAVIALTGIDRRVLVSQRWIVPALAIFLVLASYFAVYTITPMDLQYHLDSSLPRLLLHVWPAFILAVSLASRATAEEARA